MHSNEKDYQCPTCHWTVKVEIPHECNYMVCPECNGKGAIGWRRREVCRRCKGDKKWHEPPEEDRGAMVPA